MPKLIEQPLIQICVLAGISTAITGLLFLVTGSFAEVASGGSEALGFTFKAGGGVAGFLIIFEFLRRLLTKLMGMQHKSGKSEGIVKELSIHNGPKGPDVVKTAYKCCLELYDKDTGLTRHIYPKFSAQSNMSAVHLAPGQVHSSETARVCIKQKENGPWWLSTEVQLSTVPVSVTELKEKPPDMDKCR